MSVVGPWYALGDVVPHLHTDMGTYQFYKAAPDGVMLVTTQWHLDEYDLAAVENGLEDLNAGIDVLASRKVDRIVVGGVPVAAVLTRPRMLALLADAEQRSGIACDSALEAHIAAMRHLGVTKVALASRWAPHLNDALVDYLAAADIGVVTVSFRGRNLAQNAGADPAEDRELLLDLGRQALREAPDAEGLMMPGGLGFVVHAAAELEADVGIPVFTNVTTRLWHALASYHGPLPHLPPPGWGRLLDGLSG